MFLYAGTDDQPNRKAPLADQLEALVLLVFLSKKPISRIFRRLYLGRIAAFLFL